MKESPLEGGYKGFFMEESLRKAEETSSSSRSIDQLKKGGEGVQGATAKPPAQPNIRSLLLVRRPPKESRGRGASPRLSPLE